MGNNIVRKLPYVTYAENIRMAAKAKQLSIRDLATRLRFSYEHIRKIWQGRTPKRKDVRLTISRECNDLLCELLGLDKDLMFELAEREKFAQKTGYAPLQLPDPVGQEFSEAWQLLGDEQRHVLLRMAYGFTAELAAAS